MTTLNTAKNLERLLDVIDPSLVLGYAERLSDLSECIRNGVTVYHFHDGSAAIASYREFKALESQELAMYA
jgi:hypothetical protein